MQIIQFQSFGGPDVLEVAQAPDPVPGPSEIVVRTETVGVNFADVYRRRGTYRQDTMGEPPWMLGYEAAGIVQQTGDQVPELVPGDRVAFVDGEGALAEQVVLPSNKALRLPSWLTHQDAVAVLLQGMTAMYLLDTSFRARANHTAVVHAAGGGTGLLLTQLLASAGARVCGLASSAGKRAAVIQAGAEVALSSDVGWSRNVLDWAGACGVDVIFDSVGTTLSESLRVARTGGTVVFFGMAGGDPPRVDPYVLLDGSKVLTGADLWNGCLTQEQRQARADGVFGAMSDGIIRPSVAACFPLERAAEAYAMLEGRATVGKILLSSTLQPTD